MSSHQVRLNMTVVCAMVALGSVVSVYLSSMFTVMLAPQTRIDALCGPDSLRSDWFIFIALVALFVYAGPLAIAFWLAVAILVRLVSGRHARANLFEHRNSSTSHFSSHRNLSLLQVVQCTVLYTKTFMYITESIG